MRNADKELGSKLARATSHRVENIPLGHSAGGVTNCVDDIHDVRLRATYHPDAVPPLMHKDPGAFSKLIVPFGSQGRGDREPKVAGEVFGYISVG